MASTNRIDSIYDVASIAAEQQKVEALVRASIEQIKQARSKSIDFSVNTKSLDDYNKSIKELEKRLIGMQKATDAATKSSILLEKQKQAQARTTEQINKAKAAESKISESAQKIKELEAKTTERLSKVALADLKLREQIRKESEAAIAQLRKSNEELKGVTGASEKSTKQKEKELALLDQAVDDYYQLSKAYQEAARRAQNYAIRLGESHPVTVQAVKDANDLSNYLKRIDSAVGMNQRNVGNYSSAFNGLGVSFSQVARELPSLTISFQQFALAISNNLPMVADELARAKNEIKAMKEAGKEAPSLFSRIGKALLSWQVGLSIGIALLTAYAGQIKDWVVELVSGKENTDKLAESQKKLAEAIRDVNSARQDSIKFNREAYDSETAVLQRNVEIAEAAGASESTLLGLRIKVAEKRKSLADAEVASQIALAEQEKDTQDLQKTGLDALKTGIETAEIEYFTFTDQVIKLSNQRIIALAQEETATVKSLDKQIEAAKAGQAVAKDRADAYKNALQSQFDAETELQKLRAQAATKYNDAERKAAFELFKFRQQLLIDEQKSNQLFFQGDARIQARKKQTELEIELIEATRNFELGEKDLTRSQIKLANEKARQEIKDSLRNRLLDIQEYVTQERAALINGAIETAENLAEQARMQEEKEKAQRKQFRIDNLTNDFELQRMYAEDSTSKLLQIEAQRYAKGEISRKQYDANILAIQNNARRKDILAEIKYYEDLIMISDLGTEEQKKAIQALHDLKIKLRSLDTKDAEDKKDKDIELEKARNEALKSLAQELYGFTFDLFTNQIERQKNAVQDQIDLLEQQKQKDIELADQTITNAQEKADAIAIIEARAQTKREALERRQRQLDVQKARFEKARAITEIIQSTSLAVIKTLAEFPGPAGIALAAVIGAIGAVQLARAIAQPIPKYAQGTDNHPGGLAIVGDGGKSETVVLPDGSLYRTPSKDTLVNMPAGSQVIPDYIGKPQNIPLIQPVDNTDKLMQGFDQVVKAVKRIPQPIIHADRAWTEAHRQGSSFRSYLNRYK